jgi:hypothetical protein
LAKTVSGTACNGILRCLWHCFFLCGMSKYLTMQKALEKSLLVCGFSGVL